MNRSLPAETHGTQSASRNHAHIGMVLFLISEAFLFGSLFWTYYSLRAGTAVWPPAGVHLDINLAVINTAILLVSSLTVWLAGRALRRDNRRIAAIGIALTIFLALVFLGITIFEWTHAGFRPWTHAYGSIFYTMTGFHALHVFGGIMLLSALLARINRRRLTSRDTLPLEVGSLYWHYVDFIWLIVFSTLFIVR
jgi:cytochrome c oxidase subunit III